MRAREDWRMIRNHHAPIIAREDFEEVQKSRGKGQRKGKGEKRRHPLTGRVVCGCCKHNLRIREGLNPYFTCDNRNATGLEGCVSKVNVMFLEQVVLFRLEEYRESLTSEITEQSIDKIVVYNERDIEIRWKKSF